MRRWLRRWREELLERGGGKRSDEGVSELWEEEEAAEG